MKDSPREEDENEGETKKQVRMSDDAAQKRCDVCDKRVKTDKRTQSGEQEVCEVFTNPEERKEGEKERRVKRE